MAAELLESQIDYFHFSCGLMFLLAAVVGLTLWRQGGKTLPWKWLTFFALAQAVRSWIEVVVLTGLVEPVPLLDGALAGASYLCLLEFGRGGTGAAFGRTVPAFSSIPFVVLAAFWGQRGGPDLDRAIGFALCIPGGLWSALAILGASRPAPAGKGFLRAASLSIALYAIAEALGSGHVFPGGNPRWLPVVRALLAGAAAASFWDFFESDRRARLVAAGLPPHRSRAAGIGVALAVVLAVGAVAANAVERSLGAFVRHQLLTQARLLAVGFDLGRDRASDAGPEGGAIDPRLAAACNGTPDLRRVYLIEASGGKDPSPLAWWPRDRKPGPALVGRVGEVASTPSFARGDGIALDGGGEDPETRFSALVPVGGPRVAGPGLILGADMAAGAWRRYCANHRLGVIGFTFLLAILLVQAFLADQHFRATAERIYAVENLERCLVEASPNCVASFDREGRCLAVNETGARQLGLDREEIIGAPFPDFWPAESRPRILEAMGKAMGGESDRFEALYIDPVGRAVTWDIVVTPVAGPREAAGGFVVIGTDVTESRKAEDALRLTQFAIDTASDPIFWIDPDARILYANEATARSLGYAREELVGMDLAAIDVDLPSDAWAENWAEVRERQSLIFESRHRTKDGRLFPVEFTVNHLEYDGREYGVVFARDIAERKRAVAALRESEERFRTLADNAPVGIFMTDAAGDCLFVNRRWCQMAGLSPELARGQGWHCAIHADDRERFVQAWQDATRKGLRGSWEFRLETPAGKVSWVEATAATMRNAAGEVTVHLGTIIDVTERRWAEKALRDSEEKFRSISASAQDAIIMMDDAGHISYWNPAAEKILGYAKEEALGRNLHEMLVPARYRDAYRDPLAEWQANGTGATVGKTVEYAARKKDGAEIEIELSLSTVRLDERWQAIGILRDVTDRKRAERALREAKEAAEAARRKLEVANRSLEETIGRANQLAMESVAASQAKSHFVANMSHEMRTPMNAVIGMTGLLLDTELDAEQREYAEIVRTSADSLLGLINDILDFSKIEAGKLDLEALDFDLRQSVEEVADMLALKAHESGIEFNYRIDPKVPLLLRGDPGRLRQVLLNLAYNAIKFTPKGEVFVGIGLESETENQATIRFEVRDTGIGIPRDRMDCLFQSFSQVDPSRTRKYGGTGLGLALSKKLAEMMGGRIGVESEEGKGSTFWFTAVFGVGPAAPAAAPPVSPLPGQRVLIADDSASSRMVVEEQLRAAGCIPESVAGGTEALDRLRRAAEAGAPFPIALVDTDMPGMDGLEVARRVRGDPALGGTSIILLTSRLRHLGDEVLREVGAAACLPKPPKASQLRDCLRSATRKEEVRGQPAPAAIADEKRRKARILVAEDNIVNQKVTLRMLEKFGFRADAVANGQEACRALEMTPYDMVLMDVQMPIMDGFEATGAIRKREGETGGHIPILAMTAHALKGDRERCLEAGMDGYVSKPVDPADLLAAIRGHLTDR